jgi:hypothetical protein
MESEAVPHIKLLTGTFNKIDGRELQKIRLLLFLQPLAKTRPDTEKFVIQTT